MVLSRTRAAGGSWTLRALSPRRCPDCGCATKLRWARGCRSSNTTGRTGARVLLINGVSAGPDVLRVQCRPPAIFRGPSAGRGARLRDLIRANDFWRDAARKRCVPRAALGYGALPPCPTICAACAEVWASASWRALTVDGEWALAWRAAHPARVSTRRRDAPGGSARLTSVPASTRPALCRARATSVVSDRGSYRALVIAPRAGLSHGLRGFSTTSTATSGWALDRFYST